MKQPHVLQDSLDKIKSKYDELARIHQSVKEDFRVELQEAETQVRCYKEFIVWIAKEVGTNQETEVIKARIQTLVKNEDKLSKIKDNRPLTKHPFEGVGNRTRKILDLIIKWLIPK